MTWSYQATVNYPDDEQDTPDFKDLSIDGVCELVKKLLIEEGDAMSSAVIIVSKLS